MRASLGRRRLQAPASVSLNLPRLPCIGQWLTHPAHSLTMTPPAVCRESHLRAFHHVLGYAWRRHLCRLPGRGGPIRSDLAVVVERTKAELRSLASTKGVDTLRTNWPVWRKDCKNMHPAQPASTTRYLKQHFSDATTQDSHDGDGVSELSDTISCVSHSSQACSVSGHRKQKRVRAGRRGK